MDERQPRSPSPAGHHEASAPSHADPKLRITLDPGFSAEGITLKESEERYRALVELSPFAILVHAGGMVRYANPAAVTLLRAADPTQLIGRPVMDLVHPSSEQIVRERVDALYTDRDSVPLLQERLVALDGAVLDVETAAARVTYRGEPAIQVLFQDISDRLRAERELKERERRYRSLVETAYEGIWLVDAEARTDYVNQRMADLLGYTPEEMIGRPLTEFIFEEDREIVAANLERRRSGIREQHESQVRRKDGTPLWLLMSTSPLYDEEGHYVGALAMATDMTAYKEAEARIRRQQAELAERHARTEAEVAQRTRELKAEKVFIERIINNAPMAVSFVDREYRMRWFNPEFVHQVRREDEELLDALVFDVWPPARTYFAPLFETLFRTGEVKHVSAVPYTATGPQGDTTTYWDMTLVPVLNVEGFVDGVVTIILDATSRVEAEQAHLAQIETLQEMDRLKDNFINTVTHELRTPLTAIMGYCEFLEDRIGGELTECQEEFVQQIKEGGARLKRLVDDLLDFARLEAGAFKLTVRNFDLAELLREEIEALTPAVTAAEQTIALELPDVVMANLDPDRVGQVVRNVVGNAIKFTPHGGEIVVRLTADATTARLEVSDNGPGIAPELHPRVFDKFFQADPSLTRLHGGAGLGLAISKALVEAHGGTIGFDSHPGDGSTFWFTLPLNEPGSEELR